MVIPFGTMPNVIWLSRLALANRPLMNFSNPSGVVGGGEMNFATSSVDSIVSSDVASVFTSSRMPHALSREHRQALRPVRTTSIVGAASVASKQIGSRLVMALFEPPW